jgi:hypothetical protein
MRSLHTLFLVMLLSANVQAQESPLLASFSLASADNGIRIDWVMTSGSTCYGIGVERSTDGVSFQLIGTIEGVCGNIGQPTPFTFSDTEPPELSSLHYRLLLGLDGHSSVQRIENQRLRTAEMRVFSSAVGKELTVVLRAPERASVEVTIWSLTGALVFQASDLQGPVHHVPTQTWNAGAYLVRAQWPQGLATQRVVVL